MVSLAKEFPHAPESRGAHTQQSRTSEINTGIVNGIKMCTRSPNSTQGGAATYVL